MTTEAIFHFGHGGNDPGKVVTMPAYNGQGEREIREKDLNLSVGLQAYFVANRIGIRTTVSRTWDIYIPLISGDPDKRTKVSITNAYNPLCSAELHFDSAPWAPEAKGLHVIHYPGSAKGQLYAECIVEAAKMLGIPIHGDGVVDTKALGRKLVMVHKPKCAAVVIEGGFMTNPEDLKNILDPYYQISLAEAWALGTKRYVEAVR